jgi:hypothetical protein
LHLSEFDAVVDSEVVPRVFAKRQENSEAHVVEGEHDRECRPVSDLFRVLHFSELAIRLG